MDFLNTYQTDPKIAAGLINLFFERDAKHTLGKTVQGFNPEHKDCTDLAILPGENDPRFLLWLHELNTCALKYREQFPALDSVCGFWNIVEPINIQWYKPGGSYALYHCERGGSEHSIRRHLAYMTYLNTVPEENGGGTHFLHQERIIQPTAGLTCIWPVDWTYTHRGLKIVDCHKFIITGWYSYLQ